MVGPRNEKYEYLIFSLWPISRLMPISWKLCCLVIAMGIWFYLGMYWVVFQVWIAFKLWWTRPWYVKICRSSQDWLIGVQYYCQLSLNFKLSNFLLRIFDLRIRLWVISIFITFPRFKSWVSLVTGMSRNSSSKHILTK